MKLNHCFRRLLSLKARLADLQHSRKQLALRVIRNYLDIINARYGLSVNSFVSHIDLTNVAIANVSKKNKSIENNHAVGFVVHQPQSACFAKQKKSPTSLIIFAGSWDTKTT